MDFFDDPGRFDETAPVDFRQLEAATLALTVAPVAAPYLRPFFEGLRRYVDAHPDLADLEIGATVALSVLGLRHAYPADEPDPLWLEGDPQRWVRGRVAWYDRHPASDRRAVFEVMAACSASMSVSFESRRVFRTLVETMLADDRRLVALGAQWAVTALAGERQSHP